MTDTSSSKDQRTVEEIMDQDAPVRSRTQLSLNDAIFLIFTLVASLALLTAIVFLFIR
jgi:hypothetical protein